MSGRHSDLTTSLKLPDFHRSSSIPPVGGGSLSHTLGNSPSNSSYGGCRGNGEALAPFHYQHPRNHSTPLSHMTHIGHAEHAPGKERGTEKRSPSMDSIELQEEMTRLQERESSLLHMLSLEREYRVKAEQLVEVEKMACYEMKRRLDTEERRKGEGKGREEVDDDVVDDVDGEVDEYADGDVEELHDDHEITDLTRQTNRSEDLLASLEEDFEFSTSIFGKLTSELQRVLQRGEEEEEDKGGNITQYTFSRALAAIKSNDPNDLQKHVLHLERDDGLPLLKLAAEKGHGRCVRVLLAEENFDPNACKSDGVTALHIAARYGHIRVLSDLLKHGVKCDVLDYEGRTPLFFALQGGHRACSEKLLEADSPLETVSNYGHTLLHAAVRGRLPGILRSLIVRMKIACSRGEGVSSIEEMINRKDETHQTALHVAVHRKLKACVEVLCACETIDLTLKDRWNRIPLDMASGEIREILLNRESKSVVLYVQMSPHAQSNLSHDPTEEGEEFDIAIAMLNILRYHDLSDLEQIISNTLHQFCDYLNIEPNITHLAMATDAISGCGWNDTRLSLPKRVQRRYQVAKSFFLEQPKFNSPSKSNGSEDESIDHDSYLRRCRRILRQFHSKSGRMEFNMESIATVSMGRGGDICWRAGELPRKKLRMATKLFDLLKEEEEFGVDGGERNRITISLKGCDDGCLDEMSLDTMIPVPQLQEYLDLLEKHKKLIIHGAPGSGKTCLARHLADYIKTVKGRSQSQVVHAHLHTSYTRTDIFRLLHANGFLHPVAADSPVVGVASTTPDEGSKNRAHLLVLDNLSALSPQGGLLAELLSTLEYSGVGHSLWINEVTSSGEKREVLYPGGLYYLREGTYLIGTWNTGCGAILPMMAIDQFSHVTLDIASGPTSGVLRRQLLTSVVHHSQGVWPYTSQPPFRLVRWISEVWVLYNTFLMDLGLTEVPTGLRHFLSCPVSSLKDIPLWLSSIWHHHLAPSIKLALQDRSSTNADLNTATSGQTLSQLHHAIIGLVLLPTCPLSFDERDHFVEDLRENLDSIISPPSSSSSSSTPSPSSSVPFNRDPQQQLRNHSPTKLFPFFNSHFSSLPSSVVNTPLISQRRGSMQSLSSSPFTERAKKVVPFLSQRRGSLSDIRTASFTEKKAENMVSYEEMIRSSPHTKTKQNKQVKQSESKATPPPPRILFKEDTNKEAGQEEEVVVEEVDGKGREEVVKMEEDTKEAKTDNAFKRLRSRTMSLFSRGDGTGTLPRIFRRSSRASLASVAEEQSRGSLSASLSQPTGGGRDAATTTTSRKSISFKSRPSSGSKTKFTQSLDEANLEELFDTLTSAAATRFDEQRSPPPASPMHCNQGNSSQGNEDQVTTDALNELDDFLDLLNFSDSSPVKERKDFEARDDQVPQYYLSTGSPHLPRKVGSQSPKIGGGGCDLKEAPPTRTTCSMPDLSSESSISGKELSNDDGSLRVSSSNAIHQHHHHQGGNSPRPRSHDPSELEPHPRPGSHDHWSDTGGGYSPPLPPLPLRDGVRRVQSVRPFNSYRNSSDEESHDGSSDQSWMVNSLPNNSRVHSHSFGESLDPLRRRKNDYEGRCTSPLAVTSYVSQNRNRSPDKTVKYFTYHPKRRRSKPDNSSYLQDWKETASHIPQGQYSEAAPKHLNINSSNKDIREWSSSKQREFSAHSVGGDGGDGGVVKGDAVEDVDRGDVSTRGRQGGGGGGGKEWNQSGCDDEAFSTGGSSSSSSSYLRKSSGGMTQTYDSGSDRASHHQQSAFSSTDGYKRAAIHTTTTGSSEDILAKSSLTQSYSHAARSVVHHHLSHSYDEGDTSNSNTSPPIGVLTRRQKVAGHMEGVRRNSSYHESSDPNSPPSTTVFNSAVLFGASLGFFEPNSALMRSPGESPKSSRDRLNSLTDLSAEV